jgi:hypothetical protein
MSKKNIVHVVGTGTIGEPLIGLFTDFKEKWNIDEVTFHKRTPNVNDRATVEHLIKRGGKLVTDEGRATSLQRSDIAFRSPPRRRLRGRRWSSIARPRAVRTSRSTTRASAGRKAFSRRDRRFRIRRTVHARHQ